MTRKAEPGAPGSWIVVPKWDTFQHYSDRDPKWIKNYAALLSDDAYLGLTWQQRGVLHAIWLAYARSHRQLRGDTATVHRQVGGRVSRATLIALNDAGFIRFSASKPLAQSRAEKRRVEKADAPARGRARAKTLPNDLQHEVEKLLPTLLDVDAGSRRVIEKAAAGLPLAAVAKVRESAELNGPVGVGYVVNALKSERAER